MNGSNSMTTLGIALAALVGVQLVAMLTYLLRAPDRRHGGALPGPPAAGDDASFLVATLATTVISDAGCSSGSGDVGADCGSAGGDCD